MTATDVNTRRAVWEESIRTANTNRYLYSSITQILLDKSANSSMVKLHPQYGNITMQHVLVVDTESDQDIVFAHIASSGCIIAYHEAGHTVAALALGMSLEWVSMNPPKTRVHLRLLRPTSHDFIAIERDAVFTLAGEMAEKVIHDDYGYLSVDDRAHVQELAAILYPCDSNNTIEWTARMEIEAEALVTKHWTDIRLIAMKLFSDLLRQFSSDEIRATLGR